MSGRALTTITAMLALAGCGGAGMGLGGGFDKAGWAAERGNYDRENARATMVATLDDVGVKPGATREAVRAQLGEPDSTGPEADIWFLGRSRSGPSFELFRVDYSGAGVVTAAGVHRN